jgi:hypothetical protein
MPRAQGQRVSNPAEIAMTISKRSSFDVCNRSAIAAFNDGGTEVHREVPPREKQAIRAFFSESCERSS